MSRALAAAVAGGLVMAPAMVQAAPAHHRAPEYLRPRAAGPIKHVIEIMLENHTFDNLFGTFPGAAGVPQGTTLASAFDIRGRPLPAVRR